MKAWPSIGRIRWGWFLAAAALLLLWPVFFADTHTPTVLLIWALFALSLGLMWGYAGLLSFGHSAYFGLGAYTYAIAVINIGESTVPLLLAIAVPAVVAAIIGAMMFYGRISDVYMGVITLVVTLILFKFMSATAGDQYAIGDARLGGFNGMPGFPVLNIPGMPDISLFGPPMYYIAAVSLLGCYLISRWILARSFGRVLVGIRENDARCELLGYSVPAIERNSRAASMALNAVPLAAQVFTSAMSGTRPNISVYVCTMRVRRSASAPGGFHWSASAALLSASVTVGDTA